MSSSLLPAGASPTIIFLEHSTVFWQQSPALTTRSSATGYANSPAATFSHQGIRNRRAPPLVLRIQRNGQWLGEALFTTPETFCGLVLPRDERRVGGPDIVPGNRRRGSVPRRRKSRHHHVAANLLP